METSPNRRPEGRAGSSLAPALQDHIRSAVSEWHAGTIYRTCPECSHTRRKKRAPCLSITTHDDRAVFQCHHCQIAGVVWREGGACLSQAEYAKRQKIAAADLRRDTERRIAYARQVWNAAVPAAGTPVDRYLKGVTTRAVRSCTTQKNIIGTCRGSGGRDEFLFGRAERPEGAGDFHGVGSQDGYTKPGPP